MLISSWIHAFILSMMNASWSTSNNLQIARYAINKLTVSFLFWILMMKITIDFGKTELSIYLLETI